MVSTLNLTGTITISKEVPKLQEKTITPTSQQQVVVPEQGWDGFSQVTVEPALYDFVAYSSFSENIPEFMFRDQTGMRSFTINSSNWNNSVGTQAFDGCINLKRVEIKYPKSIGADAFYGCNNVDDYYFGYKNPGMPADANQVPTLSYYMNLRGSSNMKIHVPADMEAYYKAASQWSRWSNRIVGDYVV